MDPITHGILGGVTAQAWPRKPWHRVYTWAGALGAMAPDLDFLIHSDSDPLVFIKFHRHFTHALLFIPAGGLAVAALLWLITRRRHPLLKLWLAASIGYATHGLLDACTTYGTLLLWPFSDARVSWDIISIVDPIFTLVLLFGLIAAGVKKSYRVAGLSLVLAFCYLGLGAWQHHRILGYQREIAAARSHHPEQTRAYPSLGNLLVWRSLYIEGGSIHVDALRIGPGGAKTLWPGGAVPLFSEKLLPSPPPAGSVLANDLATFRWFAEGFLGTISESPWTLGDMRFGVPPDQTRPFWGIAFSEQRPDLHVRRLRFPGENRAALAALWKMLLNEK